MKLSSKDFPKLRYSLLALLLLMLLGITFTLFSRNHLKSAQDNFSATQSERNEIDGKLRQVRSEEDDIRHKASIFNTLATRGMIGAEQRLEWVELLKELRDRHRLSELWYEFSPQHPLENNPTGNLTLYASTMRLQLKLLHEEDLIHLLDDLRKKALALIQIRRCDLSRLPGTGAGVPTALLQAECTIDWITLSEANKP